MILKIVCDSNLNMAFFTLKRISNIVMIITPIILVVVLTMLIIVLMKNPDNKKLLGKIRNAIIALFVIFMIPTTVSAVMAMIGDSNEVSKCYLNANSLVISNEYTESNDKDKKSILTNPDDYEKGIPGNLDFSCTSKEVKAQFSCETLRIVEKHLYDLNAQNFDKVISSFGGFDNYAKSLGGIFGEYYGKKITGRKVVDFQKASEYVAGWMYMYGWDYMNDDGHHVSWNGKDGFYKNGGFVGKYVPDSKRKQYTGIGTNFDNVISGKNGGTGRMASECGDFEFFVYNKLGISRDKQLPKVTRLRDLKVGDCIYFGNGAKWDKLDESTWKTPEGGHNVLVGEVYDDRVVIYDGGSYLPSKRNYKRVIYFPKEDSEIAEDKALLSVIQYDSWGVRRWFDFEE